MGDILKLPQEYVDGHKSSLVIASSELGRLSIAGLLDVYIIWQNGDSTWPTPLLLVDGKPAAEDQTTNEGTRRFFYGPLNDWSAKVNTDPPVVLNGTDWAFGVDIPDDPSRKPSSYLGNGVYPSNAEAKLFEEPIPYDQVAFEAAANVWFEWFRENNPNVD